LISNQLAHDPTLPSLYLHPAMIFPTRLFFNTEDAHSNSFSDVLKMVLFHVPCSSYRIYMEIKLTETLQASI
jgi:hypothetical protein